MTWLRWAVLAIGILWALCTNLTVRNHYKTSSMPMLPANTSALFQTLSVICVIVLHRSPFHILWLFPLSYVAGFLALRSKVLALLPWLYGYALSYTIPSNW